MTFEREPAGRRPSCKSASMMQMGQQQVSVTLESSVWKERRKVGSAWEEEKLVVETWEQSWEETRGARENKRDKEKRNPEGDLEGKESQYPGEVSLGRQGSFFLMWRRTKGGT